MRVKLTIQKGFSAIIAIVLIVLFALLGTYMATLSSIGSLNTSQSQGYMQAWFAAKSGLDWATHDAIQNAGGSLACGGAGPGFTLGGGGANRFDIQVTCNTTTFTEAGVCTPCITYALTVFAERGTLGEMTYVSRTINASVTNAP